MHTSALLVLSSPFFCDDFDLSLCSYSFDPTSTVCQFNRSAIATLQSCYTESVSALRYLSLPDASRLPAFLGELTDSEVTHLTESLTMSATPSHIDTAMLELLQETCKPLDRSAELDEQGLALAVASTGGVLSFPDT